jgi:hypothetical protein
MKMAWNTFACHTISKNRNNTKSQMRFPIVKISNLLILMHESSLIQSLIDVMKWIISICQKNGFKD